MRHEGTRVCSNCFKVKGECKCKPKSDVWFSIDNNILDAIKNFNTKGYKTIGSCEGDASVCVINKNGKTMRTYSGFVAFYGNQDLVFPENTILTFNQCKNKSYSHMWTISVDMNNPTVKELTDKELKKRFIEEINYISNNVEEKYI